MTIKLGFITQSSFFASNFAMTKYNGGSYDANDNWVNGIPETFSLKGSVSAQNKGITRTNDVTGERSNEIIKISCNRNEIIRALRTQLPGKGDNINYNNNIYEVTSVEDWREHDLLDIYATRKSLTGN